MKNSLRLKKWIASQLEERKAGYQFPVTGELAAKFGLASITVHRIIKEYVKAGRLVRVQGKGTFIPEPDKPVSVESIRSAARELADTILTSIARGEYKIGDALPQLTYMSIKFGVSYKTVIDAYRLLVDGEHIIRIGKTFRVGTFRDNTTPVAARDIWVFIHKSDDFGELYRSNMRFAYRRMEKELNTNGYRIRYANTRRMESLFDTWQKTDSPPAALMLTGLWSGVRNAPIKQLDRCMAKLDGNLPRVLFDSHSLRIIRGVIRAPHVILAQGHATTSAVRALSDYIADKQYKQAVVFMDEGSDSWVVAGDYFALYRLAWEMRDRKSNTGLRYIIKPTEYKHDRNHWMRVHTIPHRIKDNSRRVPDQQDLVFSRQLGRRTTIVSSFTRRFERAYSKGALWIFMGDEYAAEALAWAQQKNIRVPEDLSIIGLENKPEFFHLGLSTCGPDWDTIGYQMAHALIGDMPIARTGKGFIRTRADMFAKQTSR